MPVRRKSPAARVIAAAAQPLLAPLGCRQKGHSLVWIADQRCFLIHLEFEPSAVGAPTCLTVGTYWLWYAQSALSFDYGTRLTDFAAYRDDAQFAPVAHDMAIRAAAEVAAIRAKFRSVSDIARHLAATGGDGSWPLYHAAVASALAGDSASAGGFFRRLAEKPANRAWEATLQADAKALAHYLPDAAAFRAAAIDVINRSRALQGLPADSDCLGS
jgi:hypothetical protein